ncbi:urea amidolyase, partial [Rhizobium leguminosarum]
ETPVFAKGQPWLLNFFDQIRFFPASNQELTEARGAFPPGGYPIRIEDTEFSYAAYARELQANSASLGRFKATQQAAF